MANPSQEDCRRELCARVFGAPAQIREAARLLDAGLLRTLPHAHADLMQFDLALHCGGSVECEGRRMAVKAASAYVFYPGERHSHALTILNADSEVLTFKLSVSTRAPAVTHRAFPTLCHLAAPPRLLIRSMRRVAWLCATGREQSLGVLSTLAEIIAVWPGAKGEMPGEHDWTEAKGKLDTVLKLIDECLTSPPDIREMAEVAALSPRQFFRQFSAVMGCTPHVYVTRRRLARAKDMLAAGGMNVTEVAETLGFPTIHGFSRWFLRETKLNPSEFRERPSAL